MPIQPAAEGYGPATASFGSSRGMASSPVPGGSHLGRGRAPFLGDEGWRKREKHRVEKEAR